MMGTLPIRGADLWVKVVEMLRQNWAALEPDSSGRCQVWFISDTGGVFDEMTFVTEAEAAAGLTRNGFCRFADAADLHAFLRPPKPPFHAGRHPNGPIYSSGRFWQHG